MKRIKVVDAFRVSYYREDMSFYLQTLQQISARDDRDIHRALLDRVRYHTAKRSDFIKYFWIFPHNYGYMLHTYGLTPHRRKKGSRETLLSIRVLLFPWVTEICAWLRLRKKLPMHIVRPILVSAGLI